MNLSMTSSHYSNLETSCTDSNILMSRSLCSTLPMRPNRFRKKLRAKRMPRSLSDGEHLSFLARRCPELSGPPPTPKLEEASSSSSLDSADERRRNGGTRYSFEEMGGGEGLVERLDGDGGNFSETAEQSEAAVWEWDDYKPPNHTEVGPMDQKLDDSKLTAFGDDYRLFLGVAGVGQRQSPALTTRPTPLGVSSPESDSDWEDLNQVIKESHKQLRLAQAALKGKNGHNLSELTATCETNIRCLQAITGHLLSANRTLCNHHDYAAVTGLLKDWQDLLFMVRSSVVGQSSVSASASLLESEIRRLASSLQELLHQSSFNASFATGCYQSLEDVTEAMEILQDLETRLCEEQNRLRLLNRSFRSCASDSEPDILAELRQLCECCDKALGSCSEQLAELEHLRGYWEQWTKERMELRQRLAETSARVAGLEFLKDKAGKIATENSLIEISRVREELESCQKRLESLERTCEFLVAHWNPVNTRPDIRDQLDALGAQLKDLRSRFNDLPGSADLRQRKASNSKTESEPGPKALPRRRSIWGVLRSAWPVQLCLLVLLCLGAIVLQPFGCEDGNNWRWAWGPQLDYVRGPPPS